MIFITICICKEKIDVCGVSLCTSCQYFIRFCSLFLVAEIAVSDGGEFYMHKQDDL